MSENLNWTYFRHHWCYIIYNTMCQIHQLSNSPFAQTDARDWGTNFLPGDTVGKRYIFSWVCTSAESCII